MFAEILLVVSKGSTLRALILKIYICDLFLENSVIDIANCADDNIPYVCSPNLVSVII